MLVGNKWKFWVSTTFEISLTLPWIVQPAMLAAVVTKQSVCSSMVVWFTCNKCRNIWLIIGQHYYMRVWSYWRTYITNMYVVDNLLWLEKKLYSWSHYWTGLFWFLNTQQKCFTHSQEPLQSPLLPVHF